MAQFWSLTAANYDLPCFWIKILKIKKKISSLKSDA